MRPSLAVALVLFATMTACTLTIEPPKTAFTGYPLPGRVNMRVGLNLTSELCASKWRKEAWVIPIGGALCQNTEALAQHVFREVVHLDSTNAASRRVDAVLTPKLAYLNRTLGATSMGESITAVKVEWRLTEPGGKLIWVDTIGGEGRGSTGWTAPEKPLQAALEEMLTRSQAAMLSASAIESFAAARR